MLNSDVLVLNKSFQPNNVINLRRGLSMLYSDIAYALDEQYQMFNFESWSELSAETHNDWIGTSNGRLRVPRLLVLQIYNRVPAGRVRFSRRNIFVRDEHTCQYCSKQGHRIEFNLDHVLPRSQGGGTNWENIVCSCVKCNTHKGGRTPKQAGMQLKRQPKQPTWHDLTRLPIISVKHTLWEPFLNPVDASYWNTELIQE